MVKLGQNTIKVSIELFEANYTVLFLAPISENRFCLLPQSRLFLWLRMERNLRQFYLPQFSILIRGEKLQVVSTQPQLLALLGFMLLLQLLLLRRDLAVLVIFISSDIHHPCEANVCIVLATAHIHCNFRQVIVFLQYL